MTDFERAAARPHSRASAREMLATAHKSMKKADIAEHALMMASELEGAAEGMNAATATVASFEELVRVMKANIRTASVLFQSGKKREARALLARMADVPDLDPINLPTHRVEWSRYRRAHLPRARPEILPRDDHPARVRRTLVLQRV